MLALLLPLITLIAGAHPNSLSGSTIEVEGARVRHKLLLQPLSLFEVLPTIDADGDGAIDADELEDAREDIGEYVARHYRLFADEGFARDLPHRTSVIELAPAPFATALSDSDWVVVVREFEASEPLEHLALDMRMFFLTSPDHRDFCSIAWDGLAAFETTLSQFEPQRVLQRADIDFPSVQDRLRQGWSAFAFGYEHLVFLLVLLAGSGDWRLALRAALAFSVARWIGFGYGLSELPQLPERFLALTVALSSAFVGTQILTRRQERPLDLEALVFGLVHGLALTRGAEEATAAMLRPLSGNLLFGLGNELAQWSAVLAGLAFTSALLRSPTATRRARMALAIIAVLLGLYWFVTRAGWL